MNSKKIKSIINIVTIIFLEIGIVVFAIYNRQNIAKIFQPIIIGLILAYVINPLVKVIEMGVNYLLNKTKKLNDKFKSVFSRAVSIFLSSK